MVKFKYFEIYVDRMPTSRFNSPITANSCFIFEGIFLKKIEKPMKMMERI